MIFKFNKFKITRIIMGIKHLYPWLKNNHANSINTIHRDTDTNAGIEVDILSIDVNGIIHTACQQIYQYGNFKPIHKRLLGRKRRIHPNRAYAKICELIDYYRKLVKPNKKLLLCIDGVAGVSKLTQQRGRRFVSIKNADKEDINLEKFNPNCISPGTEFMHNFNQYLHWYTQTQISMNPEYQGLEVIISNSQVPGEGEAEIFKYVRKHKELGESLAIVGQDGDIIMLGLLAPCENVYVVRDDSFRYNDIHIIDITNIRKELKERLTENVPETILPFNFNVNLTKVRLVVP
jgi:5'-3' exonuclease